MDDSDFVRLGQEYEKEVNLQIHRAGNAEVRFMEVKALVDWAKVWMEQHRKE